MDGRFEQALTDRKAKGLLRRLRGIEPSRPGFVKRDGRELLDLSSNDYLGLAYHPVLATRACEWAKEYGTGARASRLVTGTLEAYLHVERKVATFKGCEAALLLASGWQANATIFPALMALLPKAQIFADRLVHASIHHGIAAAGARQIRFRHNDYDHLAELLVKRGGRDDPPLMVTESVFSMDGDCADLARLVGIAREHGAFLIVDEAHATGTLGPRGAGLSAALDDKPDLVMGTFSKAMGSFGAYIAGSQALIDYLVNVASGVIYSTALPPPVLGAIDAALDLVPEMDAERAQLTALALQLREGLAARGYDTGASDTQIVPLLVGPEEKALTLAQALEERGILGIAIRPPTVPAGSSRIRFALSAAHTQDDVTRVLEAVRAVA